MSQIRRLENRIETTSPHPIVSPQSHWDDPVWRFDAVTAGQPDVKLNWAIQAPDGSVLTESVHETLLYEMRYFIHSATTRSRRGRNPKVTSYSNLFFYTKDLVLWMLSEGIDTISSLTPIKCRQYADYLAAKYADEDRLTFLNIQNRLDILYRIYEQSPLMRQSSAMQAPPFGGRSVVEVALDYAPKEERGFIEPIPQSIFNECMSLANTWVYNNASDIIRLQDIYIANKLLYSRSNNYTERIKTELGKFQFSTHGNSGDAWHLPLSKKTSIKSTRNLVSSLRDAAIVTIQGTLGLRISEICGIRAGEWPDDAPWPSCIQRKVSISGYLELFYLKGKVFKGEEDYVEVEWLAGARPVGTDYIPPAVEAVTVLWRLFEHWRKIGNRPELVVTLGAVNGFPNSGDRVSRPISENIRRWQRKFLSDHLDIWDDVDDNEITSHQWRKTFTAHLTRTDALILPVLRDHFHHLNIAITETGYLGRDPTLLGYLEDAATLETATKILELVNGGAAGGPLAERLAENREEIISYIGNASDPKEQLLDLCKALKHDDIRIHCAVWGYCFYRCETARCHHFVKGHFDLTAKGPNYLFRQPDLCAHCSNLLVLKEHAEFWQSRYLSNLAVYESNLAAGEHLIAELAHDRLTTCVRVLGQLGLNATIPRKVVR